jgi:hypothetical protein
MTRTLSPICISGQNQRVKSHSATPKLDFIHSSALEVIKDHKGSERTIVQTQETSRTVLRQVPLVNDRDTVDKDVLNTLGGQARRLHCRPVADGLWVKDNQVRRHPLPQQTPVIQPKPFCRES